MTEVWVILGENVLGDISLACVTNPNETDDYTHSDNLPAGWRPGDRVIKVKVDSLHVKYVRMG